MERKTVVVLGGGFAGATIAKKLDSEKRFSVVLIDQKPFFESTPEVLRTFVETTITESLKLVTSITVQHSEYLQRGKFLEATVLEVTPEKVITDSETVFFDYLVIATGSSYPSSAFLFGFSSFFAFKLAWGYCITLLISFLGDCEILRRSDLAIQISSRIM